MEHGTIPAPLRRKWYRQVVETIAYIHARGVIHCDLRPENILLHATTPDSLDIWLCDFGGSFCAERNLDGCQLPDSGFFDPNAEPESVPATDIFSAILTGHWPYRDDRAGSFESGEEMNRYDDKVDALFRERIFPDVEGLVVGGRHSRVLDREVQICRRRSERPGWLCGIDLHGVRV